MTILDSIIENNFVFIILKKATSRNCPNLLCIYVIVNIFNFSTVRYEKIFKLQQQSQLQKYYKKKSTIFLNGIFYRADPDPDPDIQKKGTPDL